MRIVRVLRWLSLLCASPLALAAADVPHYRVDARFDPATGYVKASVDVTLPPAELARQPTFVLADRFKLEPVVADGARIIVGATEQPKPGLQLISLDFAQAPRRPVHIRFRYEGPVNQPNDNEPAFSAERIELSVESFWLPVRPDVDLFFTTDAQIDGLPPGIVVVAQNKFRQRGSRLTIKRVVPDNDLVISGAPGLTRKLADDVEFYAADHDDPLVALLYRHAVGSAVFHRRLFGPPADGAVRMVVVPRASGGGYARRNYVVMPTFRKPGDPVPAFDQSSPARFVAHEFNHAWLPSPAGGGQNQWIGESIAEYFALRYVAENFGALELDAMVGRKRKAASEAGSLLLDRRPPAPALYQKGPLLLLRLEDRIGRAALDKVLVRRDRPRSTPEFLASLTAVAGQDVASDFEQSLRQQGLPAETNTLSVIMAGTIRGDLVVTGTLRERRAHLKFDDRGRGPDVTTSSRYDESGLPLNVSVEGMNYAKRPVKEQFDVAEGRATWSSSADAGDGDARGFYLANEGNAEDTAALTRAILQTPSGELPLMPSGVARARKVVEKTVTGGGRQATATLYLLTGIELEQTPIWLDAGRELFASGGSWIAFVRKGYEAALPELIQAQEQALATQSIEQTRSMQRKPAGPVVIRNAKLFDAERRKLLPGTSVRVQGERIVTVGPDAKVDTTGAEIIDAKGKVLLPGLWDMHEHVLSAHEGAVDLLAGITTLRDLGNNAEALQRLTQQFDDGSVAGPRVLKAGMIDGRGPLAAPSGALVSTADEMRAAVNEYADRGYSQVKLYSSVPRELVSVGIDAARARGMRVSGHVPAGMTMREAVLAGYDEVQHANFWFLNFMDADTVAKTNSPLRFSAVYERGHELNLSSAEVRDFIALLKKKGTVVDPTMVVFENMFTGWRGELAPWMEPWAPRLPATSLRGGRSGGRAGTPEQRKTYTESFTRMKQMLKALHTAGVPIVAGTDGTTLQFARELEIYVEAGIPPADVLYIVTLGSARVMKEDADSGSVDAGKRADLVLIDGDPLARMSDIRRTDLIMKAGVIYDGSALALASGLTAAPQTNVGRSP